MAVPAETPRTGATPDEDQRRRRRASVIGTLADIVCRSSVRPVWLGESDAAPRPRPAVRPVGLGESDAAPRPGPAAAPFVVIHDATRCGGQFAGELAEAVHARG